MTAGPDTLEQLLNALERMGDREVAETARQAIHAVLELHRAGLAQVVRHTAQDPGLQAAMIRDPAVAALLLLHGLHPEPLATRVARAVELARAAGVALELIHADTDAVRVRTASPAPQLEQLLLEHAPDAGPLVVERPPAVIPAASLVRRDTCELCGAVIGEPHDHVGRGAREVLCVCDVCARTGNEPGLELHARPIPAPELSDVLWRRLGIPVELAFIVTRTSGEHVALYPGPAGLVEATLDAAAWREVSPVPAMQPEREALLCDRLSEPPRYYHASIAACYAVTGLFRRHWRGGRREAWSQVRGFLAGLAGSP